MPSLAPDAFGNLHVSCHDVANGDLKYARKVGTAWTTRSSTPPASSDRTARSSSTTQAFRVSYYGHRSGI